MDVLDRLRIISEGKPGRRVIARHVFFDLQIQVDQEQTDIVNLIGDRHKPQLDFLQGVHGHPAVIGADIVCQAARIVEDGIRVPCKRGGSVGFMQQTSLCVRQGVIFGGVLSGQTEKAACQQRRRVCIGKMDILHGVNGSAAGKKYRIHGTSVLDVALLKTFQKLPQFVQPVDAF